MQFLFLLKGKASPTTLPHHPQSDENTTRKGIPRPEYTMSTHLLLVSALSDTYTSFTIMIGIILVNNSLTSLSGNSHSPA